MERLISVAFDMRFENVQEMNAINEFALELLATVPAQTDTQKQVHHDLRARAHSHLGNGAGILRDFRLADEHFRQADLHLALGSGDPLEKAQSLELRVASEFRQKRFEVAEGLAERAANIYERCGDLHAKGKVLLLIAASRIDQDRFESALELLEAALLSLDEQVDPGVKTRVLHNRILILEQLGRTHEALEELQQLLPQYGNVNNRLSRLRLLGLEARLADGLGQLATAERSFLEARNGFLAADMTPDAAEISLELALFYLNHGRNQEARRVAQQTIPLLRISGMQDEAMAAMLVFREATLRGRLTPKLVKEALTLFRAANESA